MRSLFAIAALVTVLSQSSAQAQAQAQAQVTVDDLDIIDLRSAANSIDTRYNYPGMGGPNGFDAPDCLLLVTGGDWWNWPDGAVEALATRIELTDGPGVLFEAAEAEVNILAPIVEHRRIRYQIKDLSKFVTGLRVETVDGAPLSEAVAEAFGVYPGFVGLQIVRHCRFGLPIRKSE